MPEKNFKKPQQLKQQGGWKVPAAELKCNSSCRVPEMGMGNAGPEHLATATRWHFSSHVAAWPSWRSAGLVLRRSAFIPGLAPGLLGFPSHSLSGFCSWFTFVTCPVLQELARFCRSMPVDSFSYAPYSEVLQRGAHFITFEMYFLHWNLVLSGRQHSLCNGFLREALCVCCRESLACLPGCTIKWRLYFKATYLFLAVCTTTI